MITAHRYLIDEKELFYEKTSEIEPSPLDVARRSEMNFLRTGKCQTVAGDIEPLVPSGTIHQVTKMPSTEALIKMQPSITAGP